jgi:hypothetical protein
VGARERREKREIIHIFLRTLGNIAVAAAQLEKGSCIVQLRLARSAREGGEREERERRERESRYFAFI